MYVLQDTYTGRFATSFTGTGAMRCDPRTPPMVWPTTGALIKAMRGLTPFDENAQKTYKIMRQVEVIPVQTKFTYREVV